MYGLLTTLALLVLAIVLLVLVAEGYNRYLSRRRRNQTGPARNPSDDQPF